MLPHPLRYLSLALLSTALAGCAGLPPDRGYPETRAALAQRGTPVPPAPAEAGTAATTLRERLAGQTLGLADAQALALAGHPHLRSLYARLGIAGADVLAAAQFANPRLSASLLEVSRGGQDWTLGLTQPFTDLLLRPLRRRIADAEFASVQAEVAQAVQALSHEVERAWWTVVAGEQTLALRGQAALAARLSAELAQRYHEAGNLGDLPRAAEAAAAAEARLAQLAAEADLAEARAALNGLMGLQPGAMAWSVPTRLPLPVAREDAAETLQILARQSRLDLAAARLRADALTDAATTTQRYRWLGEVAVGVERTREADGTRLSGPTLDLELPLWHRQDAAVLRAQSEAEQARAEAEELDLVIANRLPAQQARVTAARAAVDLQRLELLPLRERIVTRTQERVNYMFEAPFELLRQRAEAYNASQRYLETLRDYWLARADLAATVGRALPSSTQPGPASDLLPEPAPEPAADDPHAGHGGATAPASSPADDPHAAHRAPADPATPAADPHAGHRMPEPAPAEDPHAHHPH